MVEDVADSANYNKRMQAYTARQVTARKLLYHSGGCTAHGLHNIMVRITREAEIIGRLHAQQFVFSIGHRRTKIHRTLETLVAAELVVEFGQPDPAWREMTMAILASVIFLGCI